MVIENSATHPDMIAKRRSAMVALSQAENKELSSPLSKHWHDIDIRELRAPEVGLVMLQGRIGGDGSAFNIGEATVARAVVELPGGFRGYGQRLGRDVTTARMAAVVDALWQDVKTREQVEVVIIEPIRRRLAMERTQKKAEAAATKVDFFTLVRGDPDA
jgi:alpha-D-ribose 1-methylphosphonate 5-triphosphate synthase subunit PhnG